jgi:hypothetical protein
MERSTLLETANFISLSSSALSFLKVAVLKLLKVSNVLDKIFEKSDDEESINSE